MIFVGHPSASSRMEQGARSAGMLAIAPSGANSPLGLQRESQSKSVVPESFPNNPVNPVNPV
jgi:hypothetical protein